MLLGLPVFYVSPKPPATFSLSPGETGSHRLIPLNRLSAPVFLLSTPVFIGLSSPSPLILHWLLRPHTAQGQVVIFFVRHSGCLAGSYLSKSKLPRLLGVSTGLENLLLPYLFVIFSSHQWNNNNKPKCCQLVWAFFLYQRTEVYLMRRFYEQLSKPY